jgi:2-polyprenyl-3-methyl-5-hydroxy-6-metoxy-1,4-benzoquinol methylase
MAKFNVSVCPVCVQTKFTTALTCTDYFVSQEEFQIKQCNNCGFKITDNIEDEENIGNYYQSEEYISHSNISKGLVNMVYHLVRRYMLGRKRRIVEKVSALKQGHILDIGTGTGFFLNEMKRYNWRITGIEKSEDARTFAKSEFNLDNLPAENLFKLEEKTFDVITLWHVLEHIHLLNENMQEFSRLVKNNGKLVIAVPNHASYDAKHYREYWAAYDVPRHIWHFSPEQMIQFAEKHGFKFNTLHTMPFDSFYVSMLSEKYKKSKLGFVKGLFYGTISWLISLFNKTKCSSVIYIFEKN